MRNSTVIKNSGCKVLILLFCTAFLVGCTLEKHEYRGKTIYNRAEELELMDKVSVSDDAPIEYEEVNLTSYSPKPDKFASVEDNYVLYEDDVFIFENPDIRYSKTLLYVSSKVTDDFPEITFTFLLNGREFRHTIYNFIGNSTVQLELPENTVESLYLSDVQFLLCDMNAGERHKLQYDADECGIKKTADSYIKSDEAVWVRLLSDTGVQLDSFFLQACEPVKISSEVVYYTIVEGR